MNIRREHRLKRANARSAHKFEQKPTKEQSRRERKMLQQFSDFRLSEVSPIIGFSWLSLLLLASRFPVVQAGVIHTANSTQSSAINHGNQTQTNSTHSSVSTRLSSYGMRIDTNDNPASTYVEVSKNAPGRSKQRTNSRARVSASDSAVRALLRRNINYSRDAFDFAHHCDADTIGKPRRGSLMIDRTLNEDILSNDGMPNQDARVTGPEQNALLKELYRDSFVTSKNIAQALNLPKYLYNLGRLDRKNQARNALLAEEHVKFWVESIAYARCVKKHKRATCGIYSRVALLNLMLNDAHTVDNIEAITLAGGKLSSTTKGSKILTHEFIVIGRLPGSDLKVYSTWGPRAVICDPWNNLSIPVSRIVRRPNDLTCSLYNIAIYSDVSSRSISEPTFQNPSSEFLAAYKKLIRRIKSEAMKSLSECKTDEGASNKASTVIKQSK